jgi:hypothetical protein
MPLSTQDSTNTCNPAAGFEPTIPVLSQAKKSCEHCNERSVFIKCFGGFFSSCTTGGFSKRAQFHGVRAFRIEKGRNPNLSASGCSASGIAKG